MPAAYYNCIISVATFFTNVASCSTNSSVAPEAVIALSICSREEMSR